MTPPKKESWQLPFPTVFTETIGLDSIGWSEEDLEFCS